MGFIQNIMMKLFGGATANATKEWEENMTLEDIENMEKQGYDMSGYREKYAERKAAEASALQALLDTLDFDKLDQYIATPRDVESSFVKDALSLSGMNSKRGGEIAEASIVYGAIVQAHNELRKPNSGGNKGVVVAFALDAEHVRDIQWLTNKANKIAEMKKSKNVPSDCLEFIQTLRDSRSYFCFKVGDSVAEGADLWCATFTVDNQEDLLTNVYQQTRFSLYY